MADVRWYYKLMGEEFGPFSSLELKAKADAGDILPEALVRKGEDGNWVSVSAIKGLFNSDRPRRDLLPPVPLGALVKSGRSRGELLPPPPPPVPPPARPLVPAYLITPAHEMSTTTKTGGAVDTMGNWWSSLSKTAYLAIGGVWVLTLVVVCLAVYIFAQSGDSPSAESAKTQPTQGQATVDVRKPTLDLKPKEQPAPPTPPVVLQPEAEKETPKTSVDPEKLFERVSPAVVLLEVRGNDGKRIGLGSGFFVDENGTIVTNAHVALTDGASSILVRLVDDSTYFVEKVYGFDRDLDLAIIKVAKRDAIFLKLATDPPKVGEQVFAIGNPRGLRHTFSEGLVSGIRSGSEGSISEMRSKTDRHGLIQTTAAISGGSSGGPLVDREGNVVGVNTLGYIFAQNLNFAVPAAAVAELLSRKVSPRTIASVAKPAKETTAKSTVATEAKKVLDVSPAGSLFGLKGVFVVVTGAEEENASVIGLRRSKLESRIALRLRLAQMPVHSIAEFRKSPRSPVLFVHVTTSPAGGSSYKYYVSLRLKQKVRLLIDPKIDTRAFATTWSGRGSNGNVPRSRLAIEVYKAVDQKVDEFLNECSAASPDH